MRTGIRPLTVVVIVLAVVAIALDATDRPGRATPAAVVQPVGADRAAPAVVTSEATPVDTTPVTTMVPAQPSAVGGDVEVPVPGYESPDGVFAEINPRITCPDGTYYVVKQTAEADFTTNRCRTAAS